MSQSKTWATKDVGTKYQRPSLRPAQVPLHWPAPRLLSICTLFPPICPRKDVRDGGKKPDSGEWARCVSPLHPTVRTRQLDMNGSNKEISLASDKRIGRASAFA